MPAYIIGGSPCSGKSTVAGALSGRFGLHYFKVDDHLDRYMQLAAADQKPVCKRVAHMSPEEIWMRPPQVQCEEELLIYEEIFEYVLADLEKLDCESGVIAEGAAFLPALIRRLNLPHDRYLSLTPTEAFQRFHYSQREWVPHVLKGCSDKAQAFAFWMGRDVLFARAVRAQCAELGYASVINNGDVPVEQLIEQVTAHFGLT